MLKLSAEKYGMKIKLLNDGDFSEFLDGVEFPRIVEAEQLNGTTRMMVNGSELGINGDEIFIFIDGEYEVIDEI